MPDLNNEQLQMIFLSLAWDVALAAMMTGSLLAIVVGFWSMTRPASFLRFNQRLNKWVDTSKTTELNIDKKIFIEKFFYRHNRLFGSLLSVAAGWILFKLAFDLDKTGLEYALNTFLSKIYVEILVDVSFGYAYLAGIVALLVGLIVMFRPSVLKGVEAWGNQWIETGEALKSLDNASNAPDRWVGKHPMIFGLFASIGGAIVFVYMLNNVI